MDEKQRKRISRIGKYEGDDACSWALFINNFPVYAGLNRREAAWRRHRYIKDGTL